MYRVISIFYYVILGVIYYVTHMGLGFIYWVIRATHRDLGRQAIAVTAVVEDDVVHAIQLDVRLGQHDLADMIPECPNGFGDAILPPFALDQLRQFLAAAAHVPAMPVGLSKLVEDAANDAALPSAADLHLTQLHTVFGEGHHAAIERMRTVWLVR